MQYPKSGSGGPDGTSGLSGPGGPCGPGGLMLSSMAYELGRVGF